MHAYIYIQRQTCLHTYIHTYIHTFIQAHMLTNMHTYNHSKVCLAHSYMSGPSNYLLWFWFFWGGGFLFKIYFFASLGKPMPDPRHPKFRSQIGRALTRSGKSHLCGSTVASPASRRDNALATRCEYVPFRDPLLNLPLGSCGPGKLPENWKFLKVVRRGCKRSFGPRKQDAPVQKRVWVVQKTLGRPLLPGPKRVKKTFCTLP